MLESADPAYLAKIKAQVEYAHSKGIEVGGCKPAIKQLGVGCANAGLSERVVASLQTI